MGPDRYMSTSGQRGGRLWYRPISVPVHALHADSVLGYSRVDDFNTVFSPVRYITKSDNKKAANGICRTDSGVCDLGT